MSAIAQTFTIHELIGEHILADPTADPQDLADRIADDVPEDELRGVVRALLPEAVRHRAGQIRIAIERQSQTAHEPPQSPDPAPEPRRTNASPMMQKVRQTALWDMAVVVPDVGRKLFGDCTRDDLTAIVTGYKTRAHDIEREGSRYEAVARLLKRRKVERVYDLDLDELRTAFNAPIA